MNRDSELYNLTQIAQGAIYQAAYKAHIDSLSEDEAPPQPPTILQLRRGYAESPGWVMVQVQEFLPEPLTVEKFRVRAVYSAPSLVQALLELLASEKWLDRIGDEYHITAAGREFVDKMRTRQIQYFSNYEPLPIGDIECLENLLHRVIDASLKSDDPPGLGAWPIRTAVLLMMYLH